MRRLLLIPALLALLLPQTLLANTELTAAALSQEKAARAGERWLSICWSLDCPSCIKELHQLAQADRREWQSHIILINTDADSERAQEREALLARLGLTALPSFFFADAMEAQSRFLLDPSWYGELPRTYFIDADGQWHGKSGLVETEHLAAWLE